MRRAALVTLLAACAARPASSPSSSSAGEGARGGSPASSLDAGGPAACVRDPKADAAPCVDECDRGVAFACVELTTRGGTPTRILELHERACELREPSSCVAAARMYASGVGAPPSRAKQLELLAAACRLGDSFSCALPARAFASGSGVARDPRRAKELFERACVGGDEAACETLEDAGVRE